MLEKCVHAIFGPLFQAEQSRFTDLSTRKISSCGYLATTSAHCCPSHCDLHTVTDLDTSGCSFSSTASSGSDLKDSSRSDLGERCENCDHNVCYFCRHLEDEASQLDNEYSDEAKRIVEEDLYESLESEKVFSSKWPLVCDSNVIVHLANISWDKLQSGEFYFYVKAKCESDKAGLWVKFCVGSTQSEAYIPRSKFGKVFAMEFKEEISADKTEALGESLHYCLASLEDSIRKLRWQDVVPRTGQFNHSNSLLRQSGLNKGGLNGSCAERVKQFKNQQNNCVKCEKLADGHNNRSYDKNSHSSGNHYKENRRSNQNSPGL